MGALSRTTCVGHGAVQPRTTPGTLEPGPSRSPGGDGPTSAADCSQQRSPRSVTPRAHTIENRSTTN